MSLPTCKSCKWRGTNENPRICTNSEKISDCFPPITEEEIKKDDRLEYTWDESGQFDVGDNFGCVHHEGIKL